MERRFTFLFVLLFFCFFINVSAQSDSKTIEYKCYSAGEVYFIWGIDNWKTVDKKVQPAGTKLVNGAMHSPMVKKGESFTLEIQIPTKSKISYGFFVTKDTRGSSLKGIWDGPYKSSNPLVKGVAKDQIYTQIAKESKSPLTGAGIIKDSSLVTQEIRYYLPQAGKVMFVWGINGWKPVSEMIRPEETEIENNLMKSPMEVHGDTFIVNLALPKGTIINYGFLTKELSSGTWIPGEWDGNTKPIIVKGKRIINIKPDPKVSSALMTYYEFPNLMENGIYIFLFCGFIFLVSWFFNRHLKGSKPDVLIRFSGWILALYTFLIFIRAHIIGIFWKGENFSVKTVKDVFLGSFNDLQYVLGLFLIFGGLLILFRKKEKVQNVIYRVAISFSMASLIAALLNIRTVKMLGSTFNYQWLYYSDFLGSSDAKNALMENVSLIMLTNLVGVCAAFFFLSRLFSTYIFKIFRTRLKFVFTTVLGSLVIFCLVSANAHIKSRFWDQGKLNNPISAFVSSYIEFNMNPGLLSIKVKDQYKKELQSCSQNKCEPISNTQVKNIVLFVMESVASEYVSAYGSKFHVTPNIDSNISKALLFKNIYAHSPSTNRSMVSILGGVYPWISTKSITQEYPDINQPSISSELKKRGYRTSFFTSADNGFQGVGKYLAHRDFDVVNDFRSKACASKKLMVKGKEWDNADGADDICLVNSFSNWINKDMSKPFFSVLWTMQTHYPYFVTGDEIDYKVNDEPLNRYLNALRHSDEVLGQLLKTLKDNGLDKSTLVVVVGDHGEAFGRHEFYGHASRIYEENVHVPMLIINPELFKGEQNNFVGGHADIAPTLMAMLNLPSPADWQGQSLFNKNKLQRTYFYAPWADYLFGYRENNMKYIFNATTETHEIYDLSKDPFEKNNLYTQKKELVPDAQQKLAAWVQYQEEYIKESLSKKPSKKVIELASSK